MLTAFSRSTPFGHNEVGFAKAHERMLPDPNDFMTLQGLIAPADRGRLFVVVFFPSLMPVGPIEFDHKYEIVEGESHIGSKSVHTTDLVSQFALSQDIVEDSKQIDFKFRNPRR
ncbi:hypothetical protein [Rhodococcus sp. LB1]|uniref:hypothetical protein n=1 Tax=Rhodococcus sp. LB1 TaxID=1807499 RepID=UPI000A5C58A4|nr:hypothetical protein [Rhodococcus sp. LB1]